MNELLAIVARHEFWPRKDSMCVYMRFILFFRLILRLRNSGTGLTLRHGIRWDVSSVAPYILVSWPPVVSSTISFARSTSPSISVTSVSFWRPDSVP